MTPETIGSICAEPHGFWLDSGIVDGRLGRTSCCGRDPFLVLRSKGTEVTLKARSRTHRQTGSPFEVLRDVLREHRTAPGGDHLSGAVGYLGYDLKQHVEQLPATAVDDLRLPDCHLAFYDRIDAFDPRTLTPQRVESAAPAETAEWPDSSFTPDAYRRAVRRSLEYIRAGDIYQVNLSQRFSPPLHGDPFSLYLRLRAINPAPFGAYLNLPESQVLSVSPERFLLVDPVTRRVETRPIKGTRPRGRTADEDEALARELVSSEKDRAENVMIVDLERNDLGRVARIGSVSVTELATLERLPTVFHLTSAVEAVLRDDVDLVDLLLATFPGGSITGAPKIRAMQIIDELEPVTRGVYTGAIGYIGFDGSVEMNIAIRTLIAKDGVAYFHSGGGIVADSDPDAEYRETLDKARALVAALSAEGQPPVANTPSAHPEALVG